jgi:hypothetical protein
MCSFHDCNHNPRIAITSVIAPKVPLAGVIARER